MHVDTILEHSWLDSILFVDNCWYSFFSYWNCHYCRAASVIHSGTPNLPGCRLDLIILFAKLIDFVFSTGANTKLGYPYILLHPFLYFHGCQLLI